MIVSLVVLSFLSGCGLIANQNSEVETQKTPTDTEDVQKIPVDPDAEKNNTITAEALNRGDLKLCATISNLDAQKQCEQIVQANLVTTEAVEKADQSVCEKIEVKKYREDCQTLIKNNQKAAEDAANLQEKEKAEDVQRLELESKAMEIGDASICDQIKNPSQATSCKYNVLANKANKENNAALCDQIGDAVLIKTCKDFAAQK